MNVKQYLSLGFGLSYLVLMIALANTTIKPATGLVMSPLANWSLPQSLTTQSVTMGTPTGLASPVTSLLAPSTPTSNTTPTTSPDPSSLSVTGTPQASGSTQTDSKLPPNCPNASSSNPDNKGCNPYKPVGLRCACDME